MNQGGLMIMAGGTGGHVFPALAVAQHLQAQGVIVRWMGTKRGLESRVVPAASIPIDWIAIEGLRGKSRLSFIAAPVKLMRAIWQSLSILRRHKPDVVLGMGGFVAGPGGIGAWLLRIPLVIHEQNAVAGLTNRYLAKLATRVMSGFPKPRDLPQSTQWVGNPVRSEFAQLSNSELRSRKPEQADQTLNVLVIGGSQGALSLNQKLPLIFGECAKALKAKGLGELRVKHQSGRERSAAVSDLYTQNPCVLVEVTEFIDDMAAALTWCDLIVCRAGAMTIAEVCAVGRASLLVPYPHSAGDHQDINAQYLVMAGAAVTVSNQQLDTDELQLQLLDLLSDKAKRQGMAEAAHKLHRPDALATVSSICQEYIHA